MDSLSQSPATTDATIVEINPAKDVFCLAFVDRRSCIVERRRLPSFAVAPAQSDTVGGDGVER